MMEHFARGKGSKCTGGIQDKKAFVHVSIAKSHFSVADRVLSNGLMSNERRGNKKKMKNLVNIDRSNHFQFTVVYRLATVADVHIQKKNYFRLFFFLAFVFRIEWGWADVWLCNIYWEFESFTSFLGNSDQLRVTPFTCQMCLAIRPKCKCQMT